MGVLSFHYWLLNLFKENCSCKQMLFLDPGREPFFKSSVLQGSLIKQTVSINSALKDPSCCLILLFLVFYKISFPSRRNVFDIKPNFSCLSEAVNSAHLL